jgi:hypothetical protein
VPVNKPPAFAAPASSAVGVYESVDASSRVVVATGLAATDVDSPALTYTLVGGTGSSYFEVGSHGTYFDVAKSAGVQLDYETSVTQFTVFVDAAPQGCGAGTVCLPLGLEFRCFESCLPWANGTITTARANTFFCNYQGLTTTGSPTVEHTATSYVLTINVLDDNDAPYIIDDDGIPGNPGCNVSGVSARQLQDFSQTAISGLSVYDQDKLLNKAPFTFSQTNPADPFWQSFSLNSATGKLSYVPSSLVLYSNMSFSGSINVTDSVFPSHLGRLTTTCNLFVAVIEFNTRPIFPQPKQGNLSENSGMGVVVYAALVCEPPAAGS